VRVVLQKKRIFVDANTMVSGLLFAGNGSVLLELGAFRAVELVTTHYILKEVGQVLKRPEFDLTAKEIQDLISYLHQTIVIVENPTDAAVRACAGKLTDKKDAPVLAGFESSKAEYLVTGDKELLKKIEGAVKTVDLLNTILSTLK